VPPGVEDVFCFRLAGRGAGGRLPLAGAVCGDEHETRDGGGGVQEGGPTLASVHSWRRRGGGSLTTPASAMSESHPQGTEWAGQGRAGQSARWGAASTGGWNRRWKDWKEGRHMVPASTVSGGFPSKEAARLGSPSNSILSIFQQGTLETQTGESTSGRGNGVLGALRSARPQPTLALTAACTHFQLTRHQNRSRALSPAMPASWLCSATLQPSSHLHRDGTSDSESEVVIMGREHGNDARSWYRLTHRRVASKISSRGADKIRRQTQ